MTLLCCLKRVQNPNAAPNIWVNIQFLATQKQTKLLGDWEELHQKKSQATAVYFHSHGKGVSGPNFKSNPTTSQLSDDATYKRSS